MMMKARQDGLYNPQSRTSIPPTLSSSIWNWPWLTLPWLSGSPSHQKLFGKGINNNSDLNPISMRQTGV